MQHPVPRIGEQQPVPSSTRTIVSGAVRHMIQRPWFFRPWVRQEVFAAQVLELQIGHHALLFDDFLNLKDMLQSQLHSLALSCRNTTNDEESDVAEQLFGRGTPSSRFFRVFSDNVLFGVSDERDRVYALVRMTNKLSEYNLANVSGENLDLQTYPIGLSANTCHCLPGSRQIPHQPGAKSRLLGSAWRPRSCQ